MTSDALARYLRGQGFRYVGEAELHGELKRVLEAATEEPVLSEVRLTDGRRVDLLVGDVCVEVKVDGSASAVERQLRRYARDPSVGSLLLVTTRSRHLSVPRLLEGKPVTVVLLR